MNAVLWGLQLVLAVKFASVAYTHGLRPDQTEMQRGNEQFGAAARPLLISIALLAFLDGIALILPTVTGVLTWLTPCAAAPLALMMLAAIGFHVTCCESPKILVDLILAALAAFVAYGRWVIAPF